MTGPDAPMIAADHARAEISEPRCLDAQTAYIARTYNYWLGGKDNFAVDVAGYCAVASKPTAETGSSGSGV